MSTFGRLLKAASSVLRDSIPLPAQNHGAKVRRHGAAVEVAATGAVLADSLLHAQFIVTGVFGPDSNAHGRNEFLHIPTAIKQTASMARVVYNWGQR